MKVFIINGYPESGKTTFERMCKNWLENYNKYAYCISTIDPIKKIAKQIGWDGEKSQRNRRYLSDLKDLTTEWTDYSFNYIKKEISKLCMINRDYDGVDVRELIFFIDCREPKEIDRLKEEFNATTLCVVRPDKPAINISNHADACVNDYLYDYYIRNDGDLDKLSQTAHTLLKEVNLI